MITETNLSLHSPADWPHITVREGCEKKNRKKCGLLPNWGGGGASDGSKMPNCYFGKVFFQLACRPKTCFTLGLKLFEYISSYKNYFESVTE